MDKTKANKLMCITNVNTQNTQKPTNQYSIKVPKVVKPTNKKRPYETLWTTVIHSLSLP